MFGILSATISYYKAFKVNERIDASIEKFEGYNRLSEAEISDYLTSIGYTSDNDPSACPETKSGGELIATGDNVSGNPNHLYCVYFFGDDTGGSDSGKKNGDNQPLYYNYSVMTFIYVDLPIVGKFKVPVYSKAERTYNFSDGDNDRYRG